MAESFPPRTCVVPLAEPKALEELQPLLRALEADARVTEVRQYPRGRLLPDGRLDLCKQGVGDGGARAVTAALRKNTFVSSLLLGADSLGNPGAEAVAELLRENEGLTTVFLGCNRIDATGASALADALKDHRTLRGLWLKRNPLSDAGISALAHALQSNTSLRTLDLAQTRCGAAGAEALAVAFTAHNRTVDRLYLSGNQLTARDAPELASIISGAPALTGLFLGANRLGDEGVTTLAHALRGNARLVELSLGSNGMGAAGYQALCEALRDHPTLRVLDLGRDVSSSPAGASPDELGDASVFFIAGLVRRSPGLRSLTLDGSCLSAGAVDTLLDALFESETVTHLNLQRRVKAEQRARVRAILDRNGTQQPALTTPEDVVAIQTVYRTRGSAPMPVRPLPESPTSAATEPHGLSPEELASCVRVLQFLTKQPRRFLQRDSGLNPIRAEANRLVEAVRRESDARRHLRSQAASQRDRTQRKAHDQAVVESTGMRQMRLDTTLLLPAPSAGSAAVIERIDVKPVALLLKPRHCYVCKAPFHEVNSYYDSLCPACAALNTAKRNQTADLTGQTVLITGGRMKIGYEATLKLLRSGARVVMTTRFPCDAAKRFAREEDFPTWSDRLQIHGLDLRDLRAVERFAQTLASDLDRLDVIINNAAQTVRRPSEFYRHLLDAEAQGPSILPARTAALVAEQAYHSGKGRERKGESPAAALTQVALLPEDLVRDQKIFPLATFDRHGQQKDLRAVNSWTLEVGQIATNEVLETHYVNAIAPFVIINNLLPLMERTPGRKFVVNVSAMEGKFDYARKQATHPHTNMAKASLNMLTRTVAGSLAERGVFMNSVDTGWVTNENPHALTEAMRANLGFEPPLDEIDGAARVLDPIFDAGENPASGLFLKDYRPVGW